MALSLDRDFYDRPTVDVARDLLGASLYRRFADGRTIEAPLVEVEAYTADDPACHAYGGIKPRCEVMFGPPGFSYVYFIYGMYHCLNVVTERQGIPGAVLLRAAAYPGANGPGRLCRTLELDLSYNALDMTDATQPIFIGTTSLKCQSERGEIIGISERIGISKAKERPWRFYVKDNPFVSRMKR